jgi:LysR family transcriptional activator of nhaA
VASLNYHHLRHFRAIALEGSLSGAARRLNVAPSALSVQLQQLEAQLGHALFDRRGRRLALTEAGRIALDHAETVFRTGEDLVSTLRGRPAGPRRVLRVGAIATLSRNFQVRRLRAFLREEVELVVRSGTLRELLAQLEALTLDVVLANVAAPADARTPWHSHLLDEQPVSLVGPPGADLRFPADLDGVPVLLPSLESGVRAAFDVAVTRAGVRPRIVAEVDDMAMLRLLAREGAGLTLVPPIVVRDELAQGVLVERCRITAIRERFYAIVPTRRFPNPLVTELLEEPA